MHLHHPEFYAVLIWGIIKFFGFGVQVIWGIIKFFGFGVQVSQDKEVLEGAYVLEDGLFYFFILCDIESEDGYFNVFEANDNAKNFVLYFFRNF